MANPIDRMIAAVSPAAGLRRAQARAKLQATTAVMAALPVSPGGRITGPGGYVGGKGDRRATKGWRARARSANQDQAQQQTLIARSRDAAMNLPLATAAIDRRVTFTVGTGMMAIPQLDAERLGITPEVAAQLTARILRDYDRYMSSTDPDAERRATGYEQQEIVLRAKLESGDVLALRCMPESQPGRKVKTAWKLIEGDRIVSPLNHKEGEPIKTGGPIVVHGVELDDHGAAVAYYVLKHGRTNLLSRTANDTVRIPAWSKTGEPLAVLVMNKRRPEQARGVPVLAPVLETLKQVSDLTEAELFASVMTAMLAIIYKSPDAAPLPEADYGTGELVQSEGMPELSGEPRSDYRLESGTILEIDSESEVDLKTPGRPNPAFDPFFVALAKQIGAALEIPHEVVLLSFDSSYTASKAALETFYTVVRREQGSLSSHWNDPHYCAWLFEQVALGRYPEMTGFLTDPVRRALWSDVRHRGDGKISLNPLQEAKALEIYEAHGWRTGADITAELSGGDYDSNVQTRIGEHQRWVDGNLPVPGAKGGGAAPASEHAGGSDQSGNSQNDGDS